MNNVLGSRLDFFMGDTLALLPVELPSASFLFLRLCSIGCHLAEWHRVR